MLSPLLPPHLEGPPFWKISTETLSEAPVVPTEYKDRPNTWVPAQPGAFPGAPGACPYAVFSLGKYSPNCGIWGNFEKWGVPGSQ